MRIEQLKNGINDNARHFVDFPEVFFFDEISDHIEKLPGAVITELEIDGVVEVWIEFEFRDNKFFVNNSLGDYRFSVEDPMCEDEILIELADHFRKLLEKEQE
jgi:hypothetical protein